jgi:hypothetical protein
MDTTAIEAYHFLDELTYLWLVNKTVIKNGNAKIIAKL